MWSRVLCPQWLLSGGRLLAEVWRDYLRVEQITGFGCLVCEHHRSVPVASLGEFLGFAGWRDAWSRGEGAFPFLSFFGGAGVGESTLTLRCLGWGKTSLVWIAFVLSSPLSLEREHYGGFWGWGKGKLAVKPP